MPCSNFEKGCHLCFSSFRGRLFEGKRLGFCKKVGWLTFNLQRAQFSLDCGFLLNNPTLGEPSPEINFAFLVPDLGLWPWTGFGFTSWYLADENLRFLFLPFLFLSWPLFFCETRGSHRWPVGRSSGSIIYRLSAVKMAFRLLEKKWHFDCWKKWNFDC